MPPYTIIREPSFDKSITKIAGSLSRLYELDEAIDWQLARDPLCFYNMSNGYYLWKTDELSEDFPSLRLVYSVNAASREVLLIDVSLA